MDHFSLDAFSHVRGRDPGVTGFRRRKPDPHYLLDALDAFDADGGLYVGDRETDVVAAERAGLDSASVRQAHNAGTDLSTDPTYEVASLYELRDALDSPPGTRGRSAGRRGDRSRD